MFVDDSSRIRHMLDAAREAIMFASNKKRTDLDSDRVLALALLKCIETVGEAAYRVTRNFRDANPQIPWPALIQMRHSLVHDYFDIDLDAIWNTIEVELPPIIAELEKLQTD